MSSGNKNNGGGGGVGGGGFASGGGDSSNSDEHEQQQALASALMALNIPKTHVTTGFSNMLSCNKQIKSLLVNRRLPQSGWSDIQIQHLLYLLSTLDTNHKTTTVQQQQSGQSFLGDDGGGGCSDDLRWCGVGEREGRVYSGLVLNRHYGLSHGMGRSGDITEPQPKAVGSTALVKLALLVAMDAIRRGSGLLPQPQFASGGAHGILLPLCTGMTMSLVLSSLRQRVEQQEQEEATSGSGGNDNDQKKKKKKTRNVVLWSRIDQKSCFKAIHAAGLKCVVVPTAMVEDREHDDDDSVGTDLAALKAALDEYGDEVLAVITTTSCFAPRVPDDVDEVAKLLASHAGVHHVINHAYGLQCSRTNKLINRACTVGRVDAIVCSTDKNFLVPVGGAIVISTKREIIEGIGKVYAGRASSSPVVDLLITLLSMGMNGYKRLLAERNSLLDTFAERFSAVAEKHGERLLRTPRNTISFAMTLDHLVRPIRPRRGGGEDQDEHEQQQGGGEGGEEGEETEREYLDSIRRDLSQLGSMLFCRCVSGTRVLPRGETKVMAGGQTFEGFGSSIDNYPYAYMTAACAIGMHANEMNEFFARLDKVLSEFVKKYNKKQQKQKQKQQAQDVAAPS